MNIRYTSRLTWWHPLTTPILCFKQVLYLSLFRKALPRRPVANIDAHTTTVNAQPLVLYAVAVARRTTGSNSVEALGEHTPSPRRPRQQRQRRPSSKQFKQGKG